MTPLKILMVASEMVPFAKTGGLADVVGTLPIYLKKLGHDVRVVIPKYSSIDFSRHRTRVLVEPMGVQMGDHQEWCSVIETHIQSDIPVYFVEHKGFFDRWGLYHDEEMNDYLDNPKRFGFLSRAALQICKDIGFSPDVVHCHDWQSALIPAYLKISDSKDPCLENTASVLTVHNAAYQGHYHKINYDYLGLGSENFTEDKFESYGHINLLKGGIHFADIVNTVSPGYADEIRSPYGGVGMAPYLSDKGDSFFGILNGVEYDVWSPEKDTFIPVNYSLKDMNGKKKCKQSLQSALKLKESPRIPLIGIVSRLVDQKGYDLLAQVIRRIMDEMVVQFAILGSGKSLLEQLFEALPKEYSGKIGSYIGFNNDLAHLIEAGSDFFLMPSIYEPCGLNQLYSLKYGTLPIVRATGGLNDTVINYDESTGTGTGFKFWDATSDALYYTIGWAVSTYYDRYHHMETMIQSAMSQDYSWDKSSKEYVKAYHKAIGNKRQYNKLQS